MTSYLAVNPECAVSLRSARAVTKRFVSSANPSHRAVPAPAVTALRVTVWSRARLPVTEETAREAVTVLALKKPMTVLFYSPCLFFNSIKFDGQQIAAGR